MDKEKRNLPLNDLIDKPSTEEASLDEVEISVLGEPDPLAVRNPQEGYDYFWASLQPDHPQYWKAMERQGWRLVEAVGGKETNPFGKTRYRSLILMRRRMEITDEVRKRRRSVWETKVRSAEKEIEDFGNYADKVLTDAEKNRTIFV